MKTEPKIENREAVIGILTILIFYVLPAIVLIVILFKQNIAEYGFNKGVIDSSIKVIGMIVTLLPIAIAVVFAYLYYWGLFLLSIPYYLIHLIGYLFFNENSWIIDYGILNGLLIALVATIIGGLGNGIIQGLILENTFFFTKKIVDG